jgi:putative lipoic acid-binding regulatory protein
MQQTQEEWKGNKMHIPKAHAKQRTKKLNSESAKATFKGTALTISVTNAETMKCTYNQRNERGKAEETGPESA